MTVKDAALKQCKVQYYVRTLRSPPSRFLNVKPDYSSHFEKMTKIK